MTDDEAAAHLRALAVAAAEAHHAWQRFATDELPMLQAKVQAGLALEGLFLAAIHRVQQFHQEHPQIPIPRVVDEAPADAPATRH